MCLLILRTGSHTSLKNDTSKKSSYLFPFGQVFEIFVDDDSFVDAGGGVTALAERRRRRVAAPRVAQRRTRREPLRPTGHSCNTQHLHLVTKRQAGQCVYTVPEHTVPRDYVIFTCQTKKQSFIIAFLVSKSLFNSNSRLILPSLDFVNLFEHFKCQYHLENQ